MTMCEYVSVQNSEKPPDVAETDLIGSWKPLLRQVLISSCVWSQFFQFGLCLGAPTVIIPRMRAERGEHYVSREMASWMSSAMNYAAIPCVPTLTILSSYIGRRYTFALVVITALIGFAVLIAGDTPQHVLAGLIIQGALTSASLTISLFILTEYSTPRYRGVFLTVKSATLGWAIWVANAIGTFTDWHYIAWLGLACALYNAVVLFVCPESPYWLASKGRLEQCKEAHRWLKGNCRRSEKELRELIKGHQQNEENKSENRKKTLGENWRQVCVDMKSKCFYKSVFLSQALVGLYQFLGKMVVAVYAIDIIKDITKSKHEAYKGMLILDGATVLGMYVGCGLSKRLTRRMLLISAGGAGSAFLIIMSIYLFLVRLEMIFENKYVTVSLLTCYSLSVSTGPFILTSTVKGELLPLHLRSTATIIMAMCTFLTQGTFLKVAPYVFNSMGMDGAFLLYGTMSGVFLVILYIYLPETKDKTLKEIQKMLLGIEDIDDELEKTEPVGRNEKYESKERDDFASETYLPFITNDKLDTAMQFVTYRKPLHDE